MVFFLSLRESTQRPGTIEPDIVPSSSSQASLLPGVPKSTLESTTSSFRQYITTWDFSDRAAVLRRLACVLALCFHVPMNILSMLSHGVSILMFVWIVLSLLNLLCVAYSLWRLDVMRGQRLFYSKLFNRHHFDYVVLALLLIYGFSFFVFLFVKFDHHYKITFLRIIWPCLILTDITCFLAGWVATWRDVDAAPLG
ncbi:hypothetical protein LSUB1_G000138 [Lachnellula subtilissima]|uniref:Uncharacterized protein n=1 Tax=Lachnellula subtilissima TaxID=602034 RepID=A0A8H8UIR7_9HELO|nr:hypothetical protein LSUB1_G000138 [Lachnellula subtilissima]